MFKLHKRPDMGTEAIEYRTAGAAITAGMVLAYSSGKLVAAKGTTVPEYVALGNAKVDEECPVKRVLEDEIYETELSAAGTALKLGDKVTLHASNGLQVTATTTDGIFEIIEMDGTEIGSKVRGLFRR